MQPSRMYYPWLLSFLIASVFPCHLRADTEVLQIAANDITVTIYGNQVSDDQQFNVYLTFSEPIITLEASDVIASNATIEHISGDGLYWTILLEATSAGTVTIALPEGSVFSLAGDGNLASNTFSINCTSDFAEKWIVSDSLSWAENTLESDNVNITSDGLVSPTSTSNSSYRYKSKIKQYSEPRKASEVVFEQTDNWTNWTGIANVGPSSGASDAPVLISVQDGEYYYLAKGTTNGYHAWESSDMVNWTHRGPVTNPGEMNGRWTTTAEYKDGQFYIYYDGPNDEDPHLIIDDNLRDGIPGQYMGMAFNDPSHGSDCSVIRSDEDGLFHIIYEDWSPISARNYAWDSPLAGHTSSADGLTGFTPHAHKPPVDHRTTPTGTYGTYNHPNGVYTYEIHTPDQNAYGDWTSIKVGGQMYLFCDFDPIGRSIRTGIFTSESIYEEYDFVGELGNGHPDPTVAFAEGQFYLVTQQNTDYVSPGPWVDGVEARAGVDIDGDNIIDQWTSWQAVKETYDHKPGYIRVVERTPAKIDLSSLPEGLGFQFEWRVDNSVVSGFAPVMDKVALKFGDGTTTVGENLAYLKPATQSTTDWGGLASRAVDGNTSGVYGDSSVTHTQRVGSENPWWRVDLGARYALSSISVFNRTNCCTGRLSGAKVMVGEIDSSDPDDYTEVAVLGSSTQQDFGNLTVAGRYLMIYHEGSSKILSIAEVQALGVPAALENIAYLKPATQSTTDHGGLASRAVDGNTSSIWTNGSITHTQRVGSENPWWRVDLGGRYLLSAISVFNRGDGYSSRLSGAKVMVGDLDSNDPADYTEIATLGSTAEQNFENLSVEGRYLMVYHAGTKILSIAELEAYGTEVLSPATVYADCNFGGTAWELEEGEYINTLSGDFTNDVISSVQVQPGYEVEVFQHFNYGGTSQIFTGDEACLTGNTLDNNISSIKIRKITAVASIQSLTASVVNQKVLLEWGLNGQLPQPTFSIERSVDGLLYEKIGLVDTNEPAQDGDEFSYTDENVSHLSGLDVTYRVSVVDNQSRSQQSQSTTLAYDAFGHVLSLAAYPTPVDQVLTLEYSSTEFYGLKLQVYSQLGQVMLSEKLHDATGALEVQTTDWPAGIYFVNLSDGIEVKTIKVVKTR